jgi:hypothetical protein
VEGGFTNFWLQQTIENALKEKTSPDFGQVARTILIHIGFALINIGIILINTGFILIKTGFILIQIEYILAKIGMIQI